MKASLKNYRQAPRKARLVANLIRGKSVAHARAVLTFLDKKSAPTFGKLLDSAVSNARQEGIATDDLIVKTVSVDTGLSLKRFRPHSRGRASAYRKWMSHINLELGAKEEKKASKKEAQKASAKTADTAQTTQ